MKKTTKQYRQGDVLIEQIDALPKKLRKNKNESRVILAHGEVTGHAHEIERPELAMLEECSIGARGDLEDANTMTNAAMELSADTAVVHQEHGKIELPKGRYLVRRQREYSPTEIRNVAD